MALIEHRNCLLPEKTTIAHIDAALLFVLSKQ
jgi:hypothetical protein